MKSKPVALMLADLGVTKTHSRPHVSDDNPYSESQFKTLKYRPNFPDRFGSIQDARAFCQGFFAWYNYEHHHTGIGLLTPEMVHYGKAEAVINQRCIVLASAFEAHPERFVSGLPMPTPLPEAAWINKPKRESQQIILGEKNSDSGGSDFEPGGDCGSGVVSQADFPSRLSTPLGKDTKFNSEVSQNH